MFIGLIVHYELLWEAMHALANLAGFSIRTANLNDRLDKVLIDNFVASHADAEPFHRTSWTRGVERGTGQRGRCLVAEDAAGEIVGILPLTRIKSPLFGSALVSTGFGVGGGILARTEAVVEAISKAAWDLAQREGCPAVELRGGPIPEGWRREEGIYAGFRRDLPSGEVALLQSIPRKQRAEVRRALGLGLDVRIGRGEHLLDHHYRVYSESVRNLGSPVFPRSLFESMIHEWGNNADVLVVRSRGKPVAAVLSLYHKGVVYPYWGGGTPDARTLRANDLMYFCLMRHASEMGCTRFDFGRSKFGTGAFAFKKNWGFSPEPLVYARRGAVRNINPLSPRHQLQVALWRRLPLGVANRLGPMIARGLG